MSVIRARTRKVDQLAALSSTKATAPQRNADARVINMFQENAGYFGHCISTISGDRRFLDIDCTHNVANTFSVHIHVPPFNEAFCNVRDPGLHYQVVRCPISGDVAQGVMTGPALISVHSAMGGSSQALIGYFRPLP